MAKTDQQYVELKRPGAPNPRPDSERPSWGKIGETVLRAKSHQEAEDKIREVEHLPIPAQTVARKNLKFEICARAYIYGVVDSLNQAVVLSGVAFQTAQAMREADGWDEFAAQVQSNAVRAALAENPKGRLNLSLAPDQKATIVSEFERQFQSIAPLTAELERVLADLSNHEPSTADYARLIKNVQSLRAEVEHLSGVARYRTAQGKLDAAEIAASTLSPEAAKKAESNKGLDSLFIESLQN